MNNQWNQKFHVIPPKGFLNDPNGLCYFNEEYHIYFQYCPSNVEGQGLKHWGHYTTKNFIQYEYKGIVLSPDIPEDANGVYSGCAFCKDDVQMLFYTGNVKEVGDHDYISSGRGANVICVTSKDGTNMTKKQVLLRNEDYPDYCSCHVRDPKVWEENGEYFMVLGARNNDSKGLVLYYKSNDLIKWDFYGTMQKEDFGYMWECPDYFYIQNQAYLNISPQGLNHCETKYQNIYQSGYFILPYKNLEQNLNANLSEFYEWDYGFDFYAPQTFVDYLGNNILIGWMGLPDSPYQNNSTIYGYQHCLTIPRKLLRKDDNNILQIPFGEWDKYQKNPQKNPINITLPSRGICKTQYNFALHFDNKLHLSYDGKLLSLKFTDENYGGGRDIRKVEVSSCENLEFFIDMSSIEIFINDGEIVLSTQFYPDNNIELLWENIEGTVWEIGGFSNENQK